MYYIYLCGFPLGSWALVWPRAGVLRSACVKIHQSSIMRLIKFLLSLYYDARVIYYCWGERYQNSFNKEVVTFLSQFMEYWCCTTTTVVCISLVEHVGNDHLPSPHWLLNGSVCSRNRRVPFEPPPYHRHDVHDPSTTAVDTEKPNTAVRVLHQSPQSVRLR